MRLFSWLRERTGTNYATRAARQQRAKNSPARFRPRMEALEDRALLSTLSVLNANDGGPGSLRAEIAAAHAGDTIAFAPALNGHTITLTSGELLINKSLTISGPGESNLTISGNNHSRVFEVAAGTQVALSGLTISNGFDVQGAGILNSGTLTVNDSVLSGNSANKVVKRSTLPNAGGGIENNGTLTLGNCNLTGNSASLGGGIDNHGAATINLSTLTGNSATSAGGGINNQSALSVNNSALSNNTAFNNGGGINSYGTGTVTVAVSGSNLTGNTAATGYGGGISSRGPLLTVSASTFTGNHAYEDGGGISATSAPNAKIVVSDSTLSGNSAYDGGGIQASNAYGSTTITNCTLSDNSAKSGGGAISAGSATMTVSGSTLSGSSALYGGAIEVFTGALTLDNSNLNNNMATGEGGGIYNYGPGSHGTPTVTVKNFSSINGNTAPAGTGADIDNLGVIYVDSSSTIGIVNGNPVILI